MLTADKFADAVRKGNGTFALEKVRIDCGQRRILRGGGSLVLKPTGLELTVTLSNSVRLPPEPQGVVKAKDCWKLEARVDGRLGISSDRLAPAPHRRIMDGVQTLTFDLHGVDLEIPRPYRQTTNQFRKQYNQPPLKGPRRRIEFFALIPKTELMFLNAHTETTVKHPFLGAMGSSSRTDSYLAETKDFEFALVERDGDLHVHARSRPGYRGRNRAEDERLMQGFLSAVGFIHGVHPWPCRQRAWLNGRQWLNWVRVPEPRAHTRYPPFPRGFGIGMNENDPKLSVGRSLSLAAEYFGGGGSLAEAVTPLLHFYRESTDSDMHFRLGTHALCSILEGLVRAIGDEITATQPQAKAAATRFAAAQAKAAGALKAQLEDSVERRRLVGLIEKAQMFTIQEEFKRVCEHLGLSWDGLFAVHFAAWKAERNPTHHGRLSESRDVEFHNQALIASGITLLILRVVGYHGAAFKKLWGIEGTTCQI
jgi:hypothetical protein